MKKAAPTQVLAVTDRYAGLLARIRRVSALARKETYQVLRDPSSLAIGIVLPVILILLFGYGLSLDVRNVPVAVVLEETSPEALDLTARFQLSRYFQVTAVRSMAEAEALMLNRRVDGIVCLQENFSRRLQAGNVPVQVLVHGTDSNRARIIQAYTQGIISQWAVRQAAADRANPGGPVTVTDRLWFNEANDSHYFLVPGLIALVMTLIGAYLTAMVVAREWERGTLETIFVTPVRAGEFLLSKIIPYFVLGLIALGLCLLAARFLFHVPLRGSLVVLTVTSMLYLLVTLGMGLLVSTVTKSQFVACQIVLVVTFLPATLLSGFIFDLHNVPVAVQVISYALPARYYVAILQTAFLVGNVWSVVLPNAAVLAFMAAIMLALVRAATKKTLA